MTPPPVPDVLAAAVRALAAAGADVDDQRRVIAGLLEEGRVPVAADVVDRLEQAAGRHADPGHRLGGEVAVVGHAGYPPRLDDAWPELGAPLWLFLRGPTAQDEPVGSDAKGPGLTALARRRPAVAVVGTRHPTADGLRTAHDLAHACAAAGATVVSGLARGIDQAAHRGALAAGGATVAVLGTGFDVDYPRGDAALRQEILHSGGLVTELPPGAPPRPRQFLARNRIIAGLADLAVVVEGRARSGALHTARMAASQGRDVWAVPGSLNAPASQAPLALIRDGAQVVTSVDDVVHALGLPGTDDRGRDGPAAQRLFEAAPPAGSPHPSAEDRPVWHLLGAVPISVDELVAHTGRDVASVLRSVGRLARQGLATHAPGGVARSP